MSARLTQQEFVARSALQHNSYYSYENVCYVDVHTVVDITCPIHGSFMQRPNDHLHSGNGCPKCRYISNGLLRTQRARDNFIKKAIEQHGLKYNYDESQYINSTTSITIICPVHGKFTQTPNKHLSGCGCPACGRFSLLKRTSQEQFIKQALEVHGDRYGYCDAVYEKSNIKVKIDCKIHGSFLQTPAGHLSGQGCPKCGYEKNSKTAVGGYNEFTIKPTDIGSFYFALLQNKKDQYYKIGITKNGAQNRLKNSGCVVTILMELYGKLIDMYCYEQYILQEMKEFRYKCHSQDRNIKRSGGWTECFPLHCEDKIKELISGIISNLLPPKLGE